MKEVCQSVLLNGKCPIEDQLVFQIENSIPDWRKLNGKEQLFFFKKEEWIRVEGQLKIFKGKGFFSKESLLLRNLAVKILVVD